MSKRLPFYMQYDAMDCGPACLRMIAEYYGKTFSLETLREKCFITREGVSLLGISEAAESISFQTLAGKFTLEKLEKEVNYPFIVFWSQNHFVIVYKIKTKKKSKNHSETYVYIADPGLGFLKLKKEEFLEGWLSTKTYGEDKGIALLLRPSNDFYKLDGEVKSKSNFKFLFNYFNRYRKVFRAGYFRVNRWEYITTYISVFNASNS